MHLACILHVFFRFVMTRSYRRPLRVAHAQQFSVLEVFNTPHPERADAVGFMGVTTATSSFPPSTPNPSCVIQFTRQAFMCAAFYDKSPAPTPCLYEPAVK